MNELMAQIRDLRDRGDMHLFRQLVQEVDKLAQNTNKDYKTKNQLR